MKSLQSELRAHDPLVHEAPLSQAEAQHMRRAVLSTAASSTHRFAGRRRAWAVAGALAVTAAAAGVSRWLPAHPNEAPPPSGVLVESATRQLQFATPSGTRVIWVFNPDFQP